MTETIQSQLDTLRALRLPDLQARFAELVGEETRCPNKAFLLRRIGEALEARAARATSAEDETVEAVTPTDDAPARDEVADDTPPNDAPAPTDTLADDVQGAEPDGARLQDLNVEQLRARYLDVVGRGTGSHDKRYLIWKIRQAQQGKVPVGPVGRRQPGEPPVEHKVLPLRMPAETVEALDDVWRRRGLKSRMDLFRHALDQYLTGLGEEAAATRVRSA
jgi:hypothetical protein